MLRDGGHLIERDCEGNGWFVTLTISGGTQAAYDAMSMASGYIVDRLNRWLRDKVSKGWYCYVWELQDRGAPHLHYLLRCDKHVTQKDLGAAIQCEWRRILLDVSAESQVDLFEKLAGGTWKDDERKPFVNVTYVTHDLGCYIAKYASKARSKGGAGTTWRPGRWWALSYPLRKAVLRERLTVKVRFPTMEVAHRALSHLVTQARGAATSVLECDIARTFGVMCFSLDTFVSKARELALALVDLVEVGDMSALLTLANSCVRTV
jgi:hypothetical protein